jgi:hypothetical protein
MSKVKRYRNSFTNKKCTLKLQVELLYTTLGVVLPYAPKGLRVNLVSILKSQGAIPRNYSWK